MILVGQGAIFLGVKAPDNGPALKLLPMGFQDFIETEKPGSASPEPFRRTLR